MTQLSWSESIAYKHEVQNFVQWCDKHSHYDNTKKTVEMVFDPKSIGDQWPEYSPADS